MSDFEILLAAPTEEQNSNTVYLDPIEVKKFIRRIRNVNFFLSVDIPLIIQFDEGKPTKGFNVNESIKVSARQVQEILTKKVDFNRRKAENDKPTGLIEVTRYGNCIFVG